MLSRSTIFTTLHKGASTFIADELGRYLLTTGYYDDFRPVGALRLKGRDMADMGDWPDEGLVGVRVYPAELRKLYEEHPDFSAFIDNAALVFVQRDPRDTAVSLFYSKAYSHTTNVLNHEKFVQERERLQSMSTLDGVKEFTAKVGVGEFRGLHRMHKVHGGIMTSYEDLVTNPAGWFETVGEYIGWPDEFIETVTQKFAHSFDPPDAADPLQHKRRITPGNWTEVFDDELIDHFDAEIGDLLRANGYS